MRVSWNLEKDEDTGDVYIFSCGTRAVSKDNMEELGAVVSIDYGNNADEVKVCQVNHQVCMLSVSIFIDEAMYLNGIITSLLSGHQVTGREP